MYKWNPLDCLLFERNNRLWYKCGADVQYELKLKDAFTRDNFAQYAVAVGGYSFYLP